MYDPVRSRGGVSNPISGSLPEMIHQMITNRDTLCARLYRLAELVELARQLPPEDRARTDRMIAQARQAVCEARRNEQQERARLTTTRVIVLRLLARDAHQKAELRFMDDDTSRQ
jgi:hypothetical protein